MQTAMLVPKSERGRVSVMLGIAMAPNGEDCSHRVPEGGKGSQDLQLFYAGRFLYWKGMELGLHAFARFLATGRAGTITLYGAGPEGDRWRQLVERLGIADHVSWIDVLERQQFIAAMKQYDALLFPSLHDSGGMVVLETLACGLPVICLDVGGPGVMVEHGKTGFKTAVRDWDHAVEGLCKAMIALSDDPGLRRRMGEAAAASVREKFLWGGMVDRIDHIYQAVTVRDRPAGK
jgi:glycosyltransferase involved in cell wall biosynthesis